MVTLFFYLWYSHAALTTAFKIFMFFKVQIQSHVSYGAVSHNPGQKQSDHWSTPHEFAICGADVG